MDNFYPRSPCGERRSNPNAPLVTQISIHALLAESDFTPHFQNGRSYKFLSTLSLRRATALYTLIIMSGVFLSTLSLRRATLECLPYPVMMWMISIHALLAESDASFLSGRSCFSDFYPRSPCGERLFFFIVTRFHIFISIHALLAESDLW